MIPKSPARIVLDTNVCLDLFVFRDPRWLRLMQALTNGDVEAVTRADCRMEWRIVLGYAHLGLDEAMQIRICAEFDALIKVCADSIPDPSIKLPICRDTDDQKFIELAYQSGATTLITKDKALLKLARKAQKAGLFQIMTPEMWVSMESISTGD
jgi:putative PIN family toxin of toxin-antitoxin system